MFDRLRSHLRSLVGRTGEELVELLARQTEATLEGARLVRRTVVEYTTDEARRGMVDVEHAGDDTRAELVEALARALVTPIDREDLFRVSRSVDDVLDNLRDFARELDLYGVEREELFVPVIDAIIRGIEVLGDAIGGIVEHPTGTADAALAASKQSNEVRRLYQHQMARLLDGDVSSGMLKRRELLRRLDVVGLRLGEAASALADGVLKRGY
jgi:uncharacterized protein